MAQVKNHGKLKVVDGTGTHTPSMHTGHGAPPHLSTPSHKKPPMHASLTRKDFPRVKATGVPKNQKAVPERRGKVESKVAQMATGGPRRNLKKLASPASGQQQVGSFYQQVPDLTRTRFQSPVMADTQQNPTPGGNLGSPKPSRTPGGGTY